MENERHEALIELIPAFALGSLEPHETQMLEQHLASCEICQAELRAYQRVTDLLSLAVPQVEPDPSLRQTIIQKVRSFQSAREPRRSPSLLALVGRLQQSVRLTYWQLALIMLLVAGLVAGALLFDFSGAPQRTQIALAEPGGVGDAAGLIVVGQDGHIGALIVENMPELGPDSQYQLWLIEEDGDRVNGGLFSVKEYGYQSVVIYSKQPFDTYLHFGITIEPLGGSESPTSDPILVSR